MMNAPCKSLLKPLVVGAFLATLCLPAFADTLVTVKLWDKGAEMATDLGLENPGADMSKAKMGMTLSRKTAPAGTVTFKVTNISKAIVHELVIVRYPEPGKMLPYSDADLKVDEDKAGHMGEVSELDPGKGGSVSISMKPGHYLLVCNIPGHYKTGMWAEFSVK
jgi:uncharacterized cupredoxin-like copper-binding protein